MPLRRSLLPIPLLPPLLAALAPACRPKPPPPQDSPPTDAAVASPAVDASRDTPPRDAAAARPSPPSREALAARAGDIGAGRAAMKRGDTAAAVAAFSRALEVLPDDPQVLGERGFAKLNAADDAAARVDFQRAIDLGGAPALRAQLYFNVGLLEEKHGDAHAARVAFARSQRLHPTLAAADKLASGTKPCPVEVDAPSAPKAYASWAELARALDPSANARTDAEARDALCAHSWCRALEEMGGVTLGPGDAGRTRPLVLESGGTLYLLPDAVREGSGGGFKCPMEGPSVTLTWVRGLLRVDTTEELCTTKCTSRDWVDCSPDSEGTRRSSSLFDLRASKSFVRVTWDDATTEPQTLGAVADLDVDDEGRLTFQGCELHRRVPVRPEAEPHVVTPK
jgi:hypothetical protein